MLCCMTRQRHVVSTPTRSSDRLWSLYASLFPSVVDRPHHQPRVPLSFDVFVSVGCRTAVYLSRPRFVARPE